MHKRILKVTGTTKRKQLCVFEDRNEELYLDERLESTETANITGLEILKGEVEYALKNTKKTIAVGSDKVSIELIQMINDKNIEVLTDLFNTTYSTGIIPQEWLPSRFIGQTKKANAVEYADHRTICLMSHALKVLHDVEAGVQVNEKRLNNIEYADHTVVISDCIDP
ncbi:hypothetical protein ILUMI_24227 [Ignelater luminosus]|uniref:Uncharacterized protein n=1 Tax=Ignelater luminosus TaxID=2038154 RepID=A0A8K0C6M9_IGNLU|nr:hypothetical protein ILUMI_24227 [Ignelater luminosus]